MKQRGFVQGFRSYSPSQLEKMNQDLSISMSPHTLRACQVYYQNIARRDPYIEELQLLDLLAHPHYTSNELTISELTCTDRFAAQTYSDLLEKRRTVYPDKRSPITIAEMLSVCDAALHRAGERRPLMKKRLWFEHKSTKKGLRATNSPGERGSRFTLRLLPAANTAKPASASLLVLIFATKDCTASPFSLLFTKTEILTRLQDARPIRENGLFPEILAICNGANIAPDCLADAGNPLSLSDAFCGKEGAVLATISQEDYPVVSKQLSALALTARSFGEVTNCGSIALLKKRTELLSLHVSFLRSLLPTAALHASLSAEAITKEAARIVPVTSNVNMLCTGSFSCPYGSFFLNAIDTVLASVLSLCASGVDYTAQSLAVAVSIPKDLSDPHAAGEAVSSLLGIYRLQAELSLSTATQTISLENAVRHPEITVYSAASGTKLSDRLTREGASVYCLSPRYFATGLPDFDSVRALLGMLTQMHRDEILESAHVIARKTIFEGLKETYTDELVCNPLGDVLFSSDVLRIGILIQTKRPIDAYRAGISVRRSMPLAK